MALRLAAVRSGSPENYFTTDCHCSVLSAGKDICQICVLYALRLFDPGNCSSEIRCGIINAVKQSTEYEAFTSLVDKVLVVSHEELKRREAEYERTHEKRKRGRPPKVRPSTSGRAGKF